MAKFLPPLCVISCSILLTACASSNIRYHAKSPTPLKVDISPAVKTPDKIGIAGLTAAWAASLEYMPATAGTQIGREGAKLAKQSTNVVPAPKSELASALLAEVAPALRSNPRFHFGDGARDATFHFEVYTAVFSVGSSFSADMKPVVGVTGTLVARDGTGLWKYMTTIQQALDVEASDDKLIRTNAAARTDLLKSAVRKASADMVADLTR